MMPDSVKTADCTALDDLQRLEDLARQTRPVVAQALRDLMTAIDYDDKPLLASSANSLWEALALAFRDVIDKDLERAREVRETLRNVVTTHMNGYPIAGDVFEKVRKEIRLIIDGLIVNLTGLRDEFVKMFEKRGCRIQNAPLLEEEIRATRRFRESIADWLMADETWPRLDAGSIAEARAAVDRKEAWLRKADMIYPPKNG